MFKKFSSDVARFVRSSLISLIIIAILVPMLAACGAAPATTNYTAQVPVSPVDMEVWTMTVRTTVYGISCVLTGQCGTGAYLKGSYLVLTWSLKDQGIAMYFLNIKTMLQVNSSVELTEIFGTANLMNNKTGAEMLSWMKANGWQSADARTIAERIAMYNTMAPALAKLTTDAEKVAAVIDGVAKSEGMFFFVVLPKNVPFTTDDLSNYVNPKIQQ